MPELEAQLSSLKAELASRGSTPDLSGELERQGQQHKEEMAAAARRLEEATVRLAQLEGSEQKLADLQVTELAYRRTLNGRIERLIDFEAQGDV